MGFFKKAKMAKKDKNKFELVSIEFIPDPIDDVLDEVVDKIHSLKKDGEYHLNDFSTELLCDYITLDYHIFGLLEYKCMDELSNRLLAASLEEILEFFKFLADRKRLSEQYVFMTKFVLHKLFAREDRIVFFRKFYDAGGFHLLNIQIDVHGIMQYSQNYGEKT